MNWKIDTSFPLGYDQRHRLRTTAAAANAVVAATAATDTVVRAPVAERPPGIVPITTSGVAAPPSAVPAPTAVRDAAAASPVGAIAGTMPADAAPVYAPPPDNGGFGGFGGVRPVAVIIGPTHFRIVGTHHRHLHHRRRRRRHVATTPLLILR